MTQTSRLQRVPVVSVVEAPEPLLDLTLAKAHCKVQHDEHDTLIQAYIDGVLAAIDGPRGNLGRALNPQTLQLATYQTAACGWHGDRRNLIIDLPCPPLIAIVSAEYDTEAGDTVTVDPGLYRQRRGALQLTASLPTLDELRIVYTAGYAPIDDGSPIVEHPVVKRARIAALLMVADLYAHREGQQIHPGFLVENPAVANLLPPKVPALA